MEKATRPLPEACQGHYFDILRVALALGIIRSKPQHMTAKAYSQVLRSRLTEDEKTWKLKAQMLEEELLLVKEELIQVKFSLNDVCQSSREDCTSVMEDPGEQLSGQPESECMDCLTPPFSSESKSSEPTVVKIKNKHTEFLKSIIALRDAPNTATMLADHNICTNITSTALQAVSALSDGINNPGFVETSIPEFCVDSLLGILNMELPSENSSEVTKKVLEYTEEMIQATLNSKSCENNALQEKSSKLIFRLACHKKTTELVLSKLIQILKSFSVTLKTISQEPMLLAEHLGKYNNMYYILWCIETILSQNLEHGLPESVSKALMESLEESVLHLTKTFPLFTHCVWRIGGLLSRNITSDIVQSS